MPVLDILDWIRSNKTTFALAVISGYIGIVRLLRWRDYNRIHRKYNAKINSLTAAEAQTIVHCTTMWDMPLLVNYSLSFALFKTYAVPSISELLAKTKQLSTWENVSKRYADTEILISTWVTCPITGSFNFAKEPVSYGPEKVDFDPRCAIAIARTNWLHEQYDISNDDFLYTLALFILEPIKWTARFGWRAMSPLEAQATFVFWYEIGQRMNIKDIPPTLEELRKWSEAYEQSCMVPAITNRDVAQQTINELLYLAPNKFGIKAFLQRITICLLEEHVRIAMMQPAQPWYMHAITRTVLNSAAFFQGYLCLPRRRPHLFVPLDPPMPKDGSLPRMHPIRYAARPWYKPIPKGMGALIERLTVLLGIVDPDFVASDELKAEGYRLESLGPLRCEKSAHAEVMRKAGEMQGCPVTGVWSLGGGK
ncbi:hypothetical protein JAAARDRAFT_57715 [Jaapia argillacea MUCL 33604]|uniref:ER-bound oxygenase mpaB/mpaB'/Rubber oxygenase catalytic domain-containing protein n=1 Tax=Jaapia argillacea MUCL 33604 TaxID=933084 RepID=A0A067PSV2_9AGAM|nr:hypothetical protein JAAARDRAFT_57715 [Jaapia argillacea MUCL 33604]